MTELTAAMAQARAGSHEAYEVFVRRTWDTVMRFFWKRLPRADAEDLTQDVFVAAYTSLRRGVGPPMGALDEWQRYLLTVARNRWVDRLRRQSGQPAALPFDDVLAEEDTVGERAATSVPALDALIGKEQRTSVRDCMDLLEPRQRAICWCFFMDGKRKCDIARQLATAESNVRFLLRTALAALRACLKGKGIAPERDVERDS
jgi:RNA polymerase sigma factor (sigma-70 family)